MTSSGGAAARMQRTDRQLLEEVAKSCDETAANVKVMAVKLFGTSDADDENETGRLPKAEKAARRAHERVDAAETKINGIERRMARWGGMAAAFLIVLEVVKTVWRH